MKNPTIILRMTNACNLNCTYCYDKKNHININHENEKIDERLDEIINNINRIQINKEERSKIIFHGGEPLLIRADIYEKLIKEIIKTHPNVNFSIQTNATLLDENYIKVFKKYGVSIGISLDGYNEEQNKCRVYANGKNSYNLVMKKIKLLKDNEMKFGIIMTLSKGIVGHEKELYDFIAENRIGCNIRPAFLSGNGEDKELIMTNEEYYNFFKNIFEIWYADKERIKLTQIREIYEEFAKALNSKYEVKSCSVSDKCFENFISLDIDGNLYSCNRAYNNKELYYGNMKEIKMERVYEKMKNFIEERRKYVENSKCKKCMIYRYCKGGCPASAYNTNGTIYSADDYFCEARIRIYEYVKKRLKETGAIEQYKEMKKV